MSKIKHGRANHDPLSKSPKCLCGAKGVKDPMWDRYYCPDDGVWLEGCWTQCWCPDCMKQIKAERAVESILKG